MSPHPSALGAPPRGGNVDGAVEPAAARLPGGDLFPVDGHLSVADALGRARSLGVDRLDAQLLLSHLLGRNRAWLIAHGDATLTEEQAASMTALLDRRAAGEPLAYVIGECEFRGMMLQVTPQVLIPRPETELLVEWALELVDDEARGDLVDLGTGSGAIALALEHARRWARVTATDASSGALEVARANGRRRGAAVEWVLGDWWAPLHGRRYVLALSNPPYIAGADPHLAALGHEPSAALTPGGDGLDALRRIIDSAPDHLLPGAWLLLEHGHDQGPAVTRQLASRGFVAIQTRRDLAGLERCSGGRLPFSSG